MGLRLQERDAQLLRAIYETGDGLLARRHIQALFWPGKTEDAMRKRLQKLKQYGYILWPTREAYHSWGIPESVVYLDWRGILWNAAQSGIEVDEPSAINENQRRLLEKALRKEGINWRRQFTRNIHHDLQVIDFRLAVARSLRELPALYLETWIPERALRAWQHRVTYLTRGKKGRQQQRERGVIPDGALIIKDEQRGRRARCMLELDMASHSNPSFLNDKVLPYAAYVASPVYRECYGANAGCWLVVVAKGRRRLENLMRQMEKVPEEQASLFLFTTMERVHGANVLTAPIWEQAGKSEPVVLVAAGLDPRPVEASSAGQDATIHTRIQPEYVRPSNVSWLRDISGS